MVGCNELVKTGQTLGDKVFFRMVRDEVEASLMKAGHGPIVDRSNVGQPVLTIRHNPTVTFHERDIELMRQAVAEFDASKLARGVCIDE